MIRFSFKGFETGSAVALSATQGGNTDSGSVPAWDEVTSTPITASVSALRTSGTAPFGTMFTLTASSPAARVEIPFHDIEAVWDFDDPGTYRYLDNAPIWGVDKNRAHGPTVAHVFSEPGTYTVACTAHDGENAPAISTMTITVEDPDAVFSGADTAVVSTAGNFSGAPAGASQHTSIASAVSAVSGRQRQRILLRYGETYGQTIRFSEQGGSGRRLMAAAFGNAADGNPKIDKSLGGGDGVVFDIASGVSDEQIVCNIDYEGNFDPLSQTPGTSMNGTGIDFQAGTAPFSAYKTVWGCHIRNAGGMSVDVATTQPTLMENIWIGDCWFDGWFNYGMLVGFGGTIGWCGVKAAQPIGTVNGNGKGTPGNDYADHGPFRTSIPRGPTTFHNCDMVSLNSWSSSASSYAVQPCIRWNSGKGGNGDYDQVLVVDRIRAQGRSPAAVNEAANHLRKNVFALLDRMYSVLSTHQNMPITHGGTTVRNAVFVRPNTPSGSSTGIQGEGMIVDSPDGQFDSGLNNGNLRRTEFYSNTVVDLATDANSTSRSGSNPRDFRMPVTAVSNSHYLNNVGYAPNRSSVDGFVADNPVDSAPGTWASGYDGERFETEPFDPSRGYDSDTLSTYDLLSGSTAIGGATGKVSVIDFYGNVRSDVLSGLNRSTPSKGHSEPPLES